MTMWFAPPGAGNARGPCEPPKAGRRTALLLVLAFSFALHPSSSTAGSGGSEGPPSPRADPPEAPSQILIQDARGPEGSMDAPGALVFEVSIAPPPGPGDPAAGVRFQTEGRSASEGGDFLASSGRIEFAEGEARKEIRVTLVGDAQVEPVEDLLVRLTEPEGAVLGATSATGSILDDDGSPVISIRDGDAPEGERLPLRVELSTPSALVVEVSYGTHDGTAAAPQDYRPSAGRLQFPPGQTSLEILVETHPDDIREGGEEFAASLADPKNGVLGRAVAAGTIVDQDGDPFVSFESGRGSNTESQHPSIPVILSWASARPVSVNYTVSDPDPGATDRPLAARTLRDGTVLFAPGQTRREIGAPALDDPVAEPDETVLLTLKAPVAAVLGDVRTHTHVIQDDDGAPSLSVGDATAPENARVALFPVSLSFPTTRTVTADYATADGAARGGLDYETTQGSLTFAPGQTVQRIEVPLLDDGTDEGTERFLLELAHATNAQPSDSTAMADIVDDDPPARIGVMDAHALEGTGEPSVLEFTVTVEPPSAWDISVAYSAADATATAGEDYEPAAGTLTFAPYAISQTVRVSLLGDAVHEPDESLTLRLGEPVNAVPSRPVGVGTIQNDDPQPRIIVAPPAPATEGSPAAAAAGQATFLVSLVGSSSQPVLIAYGTADGTATAGRDYAPASGVLALAPLETQGSVTVSVAPDGEDEPDETFHLVVQQAHGAAISPESKATAATILDDDLPQVQLLPQDPTAGEAGPEPGRVVLRRLSSDLGRPLRVEYSLAGTGRPPGQEPADYATDPACAHANRCEVVFPADQDTTTVAVLPLDDGAVEETETVEVQLRPAPEYSIPAPARGTVALLDDDRPTVLVEAADAWANEVGQDGAEFLFRRIAPDTRLPLRVLYEVDGTARPGSDYSPLSGSVVIPSGSATARQSVLPLDDTEREPFETVRVIVTPGGDYNVGPTGTALATLVDNDNPLVEVRALDDTAAEPGAPARLEFRRSQGVAMPVELRFRYEGSAVNGQDVGPLPLTLNLSANQTIRILEVPPIDDGRHESEEGFTLALLPSPLYNLGAFSEAAVRLVDDDPQRLSSRAPASSAGEGDSAGLEFVVTRASDVLTEPLDFEYALLGTAAASLDYVGLTGHATIERGESEIRLVAVAVDDDLDEPPESILLTLRSGLGHEADGPPAWGEIVDGDLPSVTLEALDAFGAESGAKAATIQVRRHSEDLGHNLTVAYEVSGSATPGADYGNLTGVATIPAGELDATVLILPRDDDLAEEGETVALTLLESPTHLLGPQSSATVWIADNRDPVVEVTASRTDAAEAGPRAGMFSLTRNATNLSQPLLVRYVLMGPAQNGSDYQRLNGSLLFERGRATANLSVVPLVDDLDEPNETVALRLLPGSGYRLGGSRNATLGILDNNVPAVALLALANAAESPARPGRLIVTRTSQDVGAPLRVDYDVAGDATPGQDYAALPGRVVIPAGVASSQIEVLPAPDDVDEPRETVVVRLRPSPAYAVRLPGAAGVAINDAPSSAPPPSVPQEMPVAMAAPLAVNWTSQGHAFLQWTSPTDPGPVAGWQVWRRGAAYELVATLPDPQARQYLDVSAWPDQDYLYAVTFYATGGPMPPGQLSPSTPGASLPAQPGSENAGPEAGAAQWIHEAPGMPAAGMLLACLAAAILLPRRRRGLPAGPA